MGPRSYRAASAAVDITETDAERARAEAVRDAIGLPPLRARVVEWFAAGGAG
jgi:hypothetical protein